MIKFDKIPFVNGKYTKIFKNGIKVIVAHGDFRKEYCNTIPNIEIYDTINKKDLTPIGGICQPFGYAEPEIEDLLIQCEKMEVKDQKRMNQLNNRNYGYTRNIKN